MQRLQPGLSRYIMFSYAVRAAFFGADGSGQRMAADGALPRDWAAWDGEWAGYNITTRDARPAYAAVLAAGVLARRRREDLSRQD